MSSVTEGSLGGTLTSSRVCSKTSVVQASSTRWCLVTALRGKSKAALNVNVDVHDSSPNKIMHELDISSCLF